MERWTARAAGGTSQRLKPGGAIEWSRSRNANMLMSGTRAGDSFRRFHLIREVDFFFVAGGDGHRLRWRSRFENRRFMQDRDFVFAGREALDCKRAIRAGDSEEGM